jgi:hypothetical protein
LGKTFVPELFEILLEFTKSRRRKVKNNEKSKKKRKKGERPKGGRRAGSEAVQCAPSYFVGVCSHDTGRRRPPGQDKTNGAVHNR